MNKLEDIKKWASEAGLSAHDVFDDMNDNLKVIKTFYAEECPKNQSGLVLTLDDAELLAYEYARRIIEQRDKLNLNKLKNDNLILCEVKVLNVDGFPQINSICSNNVHPYFIWTKEHIEGNVLNTLPEYKNTQVKHIYYTSDREIEDECYIIHKGRVLQVSKNRGIYLSIYEHPSIDVRTDLCKRIEASSDSSLDNIAPIPKSYIDSFIELNGEIKKIYYPLQNNNIPLEINAKSIYIYSNGTFSCRDNNGEQMGEIQNKAWMQLFLEYLESKGIDPSKVDTIETMVNGQTKYVRAVRTANGWSWNFSEF